MKKFVGTVIAIIILVTCTGAGLQMLIDQNAVRQHVITAFKEQTGLDLHMEHAGFQLLPWPSFHAETIALMRPGCAPFMTAQSVHADISFLALFHREFSFQDFAADGAWISFYRPPGHLSGQKDTGSSADSGQDDAACSSWLPFPLQKKYEQIAAPVDALVESSSKIQKIWHIGEPVQAEWKISFDALHLGHSHVLWRDDGGRDANGDAAKEQKETYSGEINIQSLDLEGLRSKNPWVDMQAVHQQTPFTIRGHIGRLTRLFRLSRPDEDPWLFSVGIGMGRNNMLGSLTLDGALAEPHLLEGVRLSIQGDWPDLEKKQPIGRWLFPNLPWVSVHGLSGVVTLRDKMGREIMAGDHTGQKQPVTYARSNLPQFSDSLRALPARLFPLMAHLRAGDIRLATATTPEDNNGTVVFSNILLDAAGPELPVLAQGKITWGRYGWYGRLHLDNLGRLLTRIHNMPPDPQETSPLLIDIALEGGNIQTMASHAAPEQPLAVQDQSWLHMTGQIGEEEGNFSFQGEAGRFELPIGITASKEAGIGPKLHHATVTAALRLSFRQQPDNHQPGREDAGPFALAGLSLSDMVLESDEIAFHGNSNILYDESERPVIKGQVHIDHADLDNFFGTIEQGSEPDGDRVAEDNPPSDHRDEAGNWLVTLRHFLEKQDWDFALSGDAIRYKGLDYSNIILTSRLDRAVMDSRLKAGWKQVASPVMAEPVAGPSAQAGPASVIGAEWLLTPYAASGLHMALVSDNADGGLFIPASWLAQLIGDEKPVHGVVQIFANLSAEGEDMAGIRNSLAGHLGAVMVDGRIETSVLAPLAGPVSSLLKLGRKNEKLRCMVTSLTAQHGLMQLDQLALQAGRFSMTGQGRIDLSKNMMDLRIYPHIAFAGNRLATAMTVQGPFADLTILPQNGQDQGSGQGKIHEVSIGPDDEDICASAIRQVRGDHAGLPLPPSKSGGNTSGFLHALGLGE